MTHKPLHPALLLLLALLPTACRRGSDGPPPDIAFYYWRTTFHLTPAERRTLQQCNVSHLYIRYFDIKLGPHGQPLPESPIHFSSPPPEGVRVTPVVYIKNEVMLRRGLAIDTLADHIIHLVHLIDSTVGLPPADELQLDCDWSTRSRDRFMALVDTLRSRHAYPHLSATIRLHQAKHHTITRIPNVDRGVLMYYNMGTISADTLNSIYDRHIAARYIPSLRRYPLPLDVALPLYAWGVHSDANGHVKTLIERITRADFEQDTNFVTTPGSNIILVRHSNIKGRRYYTTGDHVKIEAVTASDLRGMAHDLSRHLAAKPHEIIFFDLDEHHLSTYINYEHENNFLQNLVRRF